KMIPEGSTAVWSSRVLDRRPGVAEECVGVSPIRASGASRTMHLRSRAEEVDEVHQRRWVCFGAAAATLVAAIVGLVGPATAVEAGSFVGTAPARLADSRPGGPTVDGVLSGGDARAAGSVTTVPVAGRASVPATAAAVSLNVTVTDTAGPGYATVYPCGADTPTASNLNFATGQTIANAVVVKVGQGGAVCVYVSQATQLIVDVGGYFPAEGTSTTLPTTTVPTTTVPPTTSSVPPSTTSTSMPPATSVPTNPIAFAKNTVFIVQSSQIKYWVYVPGSYDSTHQTPTTLLVWLHGCGGRSADDIRTVSPGGSQDWISITVDGREGACWNPAADGAKVKATIADVKTHFNIDPHRVILGGYSSGGDLAYRTAFYDAGAFAGVLAENTSPFRDTGSSRTASLAAASWKFPVVHLAHLQDTTYPIAGVRTETDAMTSAGFPVTRIERDGGHYDILGAIENGHAVPGTDADLVALLLPHIHDGWRSP
ncbi:MAG: CobN component of cobalt chelatase involved in biosynthesis, partial [Ilumatobacteraceae bacterium]|nr:CobN component of cobalt chelatase involved in biosynthesis [Ilumatobacteraceae bacterium]